MSNTGQIKQDLLNESEKHDLLTEYEFTQQMAIHYDQINWQIGSIIFAGIFVGMGIIGTNIDSYIPMIIISFLILLTWNLFYKRHKHIQNKKFERLQQLELLLGFKQHLMIQEADAKKEMKGLHGIHLLNIMTFGIPFVILLIYVTLKIIKKMHC